ncbi:MAG: HAD family acid phosphatase [Bacillota bacterium]|nr:HAD family acid phosphatase [Bacillota bacterium]
MSVLVCDIDNTIADTSAELVRRYGPPADPSDYAAYAPEGVDWTTTEHLELFRRARPIPGAVEAIHRLQRHGWYVLYVSNRPKTAYDVTEDWLLAHDLHEGRMLGKVLGGHKTRVLRRALAGRIWTAFGPMDVEAVAYVDDKPVRVVPEGVQVLPHKRPWRPDGLTWPEIVEVLLS